MFLYAAALSPVDGVPGLGTLLALGLCVVLPHSSSIYFDI